MLETRASCHVHLSFTWVLEIQTPSPVLCSKLFNHYITLPGNFSPLLHHDNVKNFPPSFPSICGSGGGVQAFTNTRQALHHQVPASVVMCACVWSVHMWSGHVCVFLYHPLPYILIWVGGILQQACKDHLSFHHVGTRLGRKFSYPLRAILPTTLFLETVSLAGPQAY